jgi:UDP-N-acetyl-D-glucosamine dehydrogenase
MFDVAESIIQKIAKSETYTKQFNSDTVKKSTDKGFSATTDFSKISQVEALIICVSTPLNKYREPDLPMISVTTRFN